MKMKTIDDFITEHGCNKRSEIREAMLECSKYFVNLALTEASEKAEIDFYYGEDCSFIDKDSILNSFNLNNIK